MFDFWRIERLKMTQNLRHSRSGCHDYGNNVSTVSCYRSYGYAHRKSNQDLQKWLYYAFSSFSFSVSIRSACARCFSLYICSWSFHYTYVPGLFILHMILVFSSVVPMFWHQHKMRVGGRRSDEGGLLNDGLRFG